MGSLRLSKVVVAALVVCLSILLISPTEVEGLTCNYQSYVCLPPNDNLCKERCLKNPGGFVDGKCIALTPSPVPVSVCTCCRE
ncbi:hypothetical protein AALP_AA1G334200 [Arabis alpina]|uniref:Knottin scorpion toxin-like domain-containing protein n=1 Tax=Arabis alpina TaxID=50452 RepID=A0A087HSB9_ARAAL|nr:hypothetical protein AALP_AA1G334200 [Arabis alpina]